MDVDQGTLTTSQDNFGIASRLARTLSVELINVEGRRAPRANPDAVDLTMRGWSILNPAPQREDAKRAVTVFEDVLRIDSHNSQALVGLAHALTLIHRNRWDPDRALILARADEAVTRAIALAQLRPRALRQGRGSRAVPAIRRCAGDVRQGHRPRSQPCGSIRFPRPGLDRHRGGRGDDSAGGETRTRTWRATRKPSNGA